MHFAGRRRLSLALYLLLGRLWFDRLIMESGFGCNHGVNLSHSSNRHRLHRV